VSHRLMIHVKRRDVPCSVVKPIGTTVKRASKKVVETKIFCMVAC
jgi:hypothetical protein